MGLGISTTSYVLLDVELYVEYGFKKPTSYIFGYNKILVRYSPFQLIKPMPIEDLLIIIARDPTRNPRYKKG